MSFFFFKQKTAYEMRISDWSSDVCSSDLRARRPEAWQPRYGAKKELVGKPTPTKAGRNRSFPRSAWACSLGRSASATGIGRQAHRWQRRASRDRTSVVEGKSVSVRVDLGGRRIIQKKQHKNKTVDY